MPKIIFRPNPVPPPFPPPEPVYPANSLKITPYPFDQFELCNFNIIKLQEINNFKRAILKYKKKSMGGDVIFNVLSTEGSPIITSFSKNINDSSTNIDYFYIEVAKNDDTLFQIPLNLV